MTIEEAARLVGPTSFLHVRDDGTFVYIVPLTFSRARINLGNQYGVLDSW